jgi:hypothetical protein
LRRMPTLSLYTTTIAMADLDDVRAALGYDKINVYGGSYGATTALSYLNFYRSMFAPSPSPELLHQTALCQSRSPKASSTR